MGTAAWALDGCRASGASTGPDAQVLPVAREPRAPSLVAVVRPSGFPSLVDAVKAVVAQAGGLGFVKPGQTVVLKPAANSTRRYPATADAEVVLALAKLVLEQGGRPTIADRTVFTRSTAVTFKQLGYMDAAREAGIPCMSLDHAQVVERRHALAVHWSDGAVPLYRPIAEADHVINLCTPRTHKLGDFTMALKNNVGAVSSGARMGMHLPSGFKERLAELALVVRPSLVVMDGRRGFTNGGPDVGDEATLDFLAATADPVAADAVGLGFLRLAGANPRLMAGSLWTLPVMARAAALGVGASAPEQIRLDGLSAEDEARLRAQLA